MIVAYCVVLFAAITLSSGDRWNDFRGGQTSLPIKKEVAEKWGWKVCEVDDNLKIQWYSKGSDDSLTLAYDQRGDCAGVRVIVYEKDIDQNYLSIYKEKKGIFEAFEYKGAKAYKSIVLFTPEESLQKGGRLPMMKRDDDVAYFAYLKVAGKYKKLNRKTCVQAKYYHDQGCHPKYGVVLSHFGSKSKCASLKPFYTVFEKDFDGDLIGFGWLLFTKLNSKDTFLKAISPKTAKDMFPHSPACVSSSSNLAVAELWVSYADSQKVSCPSRSWFEKICKKLPKVEGDSSSTSADESGVVEESFWSKLFG